MRHPIIILIAACLGLLSACNGMYDTLDDYSGEIVYPAKYDTIIGHIGFERVEIDLMKAGRIPSSEINMGKAKKTIIEYDGQVITLDSLVSWVNITGLTQPKLYRFKIYTVDEFDNASVPQEIALIPYTSADLENLAIASPRVMLSPSAAVIDWPNGLSSVVLDYYGLNFSYTDKDGQVRDGQRGQDSRFFIGNLEAGEPVSVDMKYRVVPKVNGQPIIDTVTLAQPLELNMPTSSTPFSPSERDVLTANGVSEFTADGTASITKLVYPIHANSLQDVFYFPNLKELDLTGEGLFSLPTLVYDRNGAYSEVGGGDWVPFMRKVSDISSGDTQALKDLLEAGILEKVRYVPHTMGLDALLAPYVGTGVVELVDLPDEVNIPHKFFVDGLVQTSAWRMDYAFPAPDPAGGGMQNVLKATLRAHNGSFALALPTQYAFNVSEYKYLKFKVYAPAKSSFAGGHDAYQRIWPRFMNYMWAFSGHSAFGQEYWAPSANDYRIADGDLQKWVELTVDLSEASGRHNRVIVINIGGEPGGTFAPATDIVYHFADFKLTKE